MLMGFARGLRFRLSLAFTLFAALCFVAPPAVLAFGHGGNTLDCLALANKVNHGKTADAHDDHHHGAHSRAAGHSPHDDAPATAPDQQMTCCGLFCLSALAADVCVPGPGVTVAAGYPARQVDPHSRAPERLDRPPISFALV